MFADRVLETTATTGTGAYTLAGASTGYRAYADAFSNGATVAYHCRNSDGTVWESGWGVLDTGAFTITRNLLESSTGSLINWGTGSRLIYLAPSSAILKSLLTTNLGTARPGWLPAGGLWSDSANALLKRWTGSANVPVLPLALGSALQVLRVNAGGTAPEYATLSLDGLTPGASSELTLATGAVTATGSHHSVDTEADAAADDLDTITVTALAEGQLLLLKAEDAARVVTVKHGTGNITLGGGDYALDTAAKRILLQKVGSNLVEVARSHAAASGMVPLATVSAASDATVEFVDLPTADYDAFLVTVSNLRPATDAAQFSCRLRPAGGSFLAGAGDYKYAGHQATDSPALTAIGSSSATEIRLLQVTGNAADEAGNCEVWFSGFATAGPHKQVRAFGTQLDNGGALRNTPLSGVLTGSTAAVDGIQFLMSSGNIAAGTFQLFGLKGA